MPLTQGFKRVLYQYRCTGGKVTHLSMDGALGGTFCVPAHKHADFMEAYAEAVLNGEHLFISENRTDIFRYFLDCDLQREDELSDRELRVLMGAITRTVMRFYGKSNIKRSKAKTSNWRFLMMVCTVGQHAQSRGKKKKRKRKQAAPPMLLTQKRGKEGKGRKKGEENAKGKDPMAEKMLQQKRKRGNMHIVFPNLLVNTEQALLMTEALKADLDSLGDQEIGERNGCSWADALDTLVYTRNGLRMIGSCKCDTCPQCKGYRRGQDCSVCEQGKVDLGRPYDLRRVYFLDGWHLPTEKSIRANPDHKVQYCSIRSPCALKPTAGWRAPLGSPAVDQAALEKTQKRTQEAKGQFTKLAAIENAQQKKKQNKTDHNRTFQRGSYVFKACQNVVSGFHPNFRKTTVRKVKSSAKYRNFIVETQGWGSTSCINKQQIAEGDEPKCHKSSSVYFIITEKGATQLCHADKCKGFRSRCMPLLSRHKRILFPPGRSSKAAPVAPAGSLLKDETGEGLQRVIDSNFAAAYRARSKAPL